MNKVLSKIALIPMVLTMVGCESIPYNSQFKHCVNYIKEQCENITSIKYDSLKEGYDSSEEDYFYACWYVVVNISADNYKTQFDGKIENTQSSGYESIFLHRYDDNCKDYVIYFYDIIYY